MGQSPAIRTWVFLALTILAAVTQADGQTFTWSNSAGGTFGTATNWSPSGPPSLPTHTAVFDIAGNYTVLSSGTSSFGTFLAQAGNVNFSGGTYAIGAARFQTGAATLTNTSIVATNSISMPNSRVALSNGARLLTDGTLTVGEAGAATLEPSSTFVEADVLKIGVGPGGVGRVLGGQVRANFIMVGDLAGGLGTLSANDVGGTIGSFTNGSVLVTNNGFMSAGPNMRNPIHFDGRLTMGSGGNFQSPVTGTGSLIITGGNAQATISNTGSTSISGGTFLNVFANFGAATMNGGTMLAGFNNGPIATLTYTGGRIINGAIANDGTINVRLAVPVASLQINNNSGATASLSGTTAITAGTINNQGTLRGAGTLQGSIQISNSGTLTASGGAFVLDPDVAIANLPGALTRNDPLTSLSIRNSTFSNQGNLEVNAGGGIDFAGPVGVSTGQRINMLGGVLFPRGSLTVNTGGALVGYGQINTDPSFALNNSGNINFNGSAVLQTNLNNAAGGIITARNGTTIIYGNLTNAGTMITQNGTFIVANESGALAGSGTARVLGGGAVLASQIAQTKLSIEGSQLSPAIVSIRDSIDGGAASRVNELAIAQSGASFGGALDLSDTAMVVDYAPGNSPTVQITAMLQSGFASGSWTGKGIQSRTAAADSTGRTALGFAEATDIGMPLMFLGVPTDSTSVLIAYTLYGDANLDRAVNINDFALLAANFNTASRWSRGDFNYDAVTNINDFALLAANFNQSLPTDIPRSAVPEPLCGAALMALAAMTRSRRR